MKRYKLKLAMLTLAGGVVMQVGGCGAILTDILLQNLSTIVISVLTAALASATGTTTG
jgi:hypothetical protein